jgi:hypothetical protein
MQTSPDYWLDLWEMLQDEIEEASHEYRRIGLPGDHVRRLSGNTGHLVNSDLD